MPAIYPTDDHENWRLAVLGLQSLQVGLEEFTDETLKQQHTEFLKKFPHNIGQCLACTTDNILPDHTKLSCKRMKCYCKDKKKRRLCPTGLCSKMHDLIVHSCRGGEPNWANTDPSKWYINCTSIGTCFITTNGYKLKNKIGEIDCSGLLSIIINDTYFERKKNIGGFIDLLKKAREIRNDIQHDSKLELQSSKLQHYISVFTKILTIPEIKQTSTATEALQKLQQISTGRYAPTEAETLKIEAATASSLKTIDEKMQIFEDKVSKAVKDFDVRHQELQVARRTARNPSRLSLMQRISLKQALLGELITFYRHKYKTLAISPLYKEYDAPLLEIYVSQPLHWVDIKYVECVSTDATNYKYPNTNLHGSIKKTNKPLRSLMELFFDNKKVNHLIYLTADAGYGKSSFAQRLLIDWCHAKIPIKADEKYFSKMEIYTMNKFDVVIYIPLENCKAVNNIEDIIHNEIEKCSVKQHYERRMVDKILAENTCLIILDDMDKLSRLDMPDLKHRENCSVLIISRSSKFSTINPPHDHLHVEILGLKESESFFLVSKTVSFLNTKYGTDRKAQYFYDELVKHKINDIIHVPLLLMQSLCLWYDKETHGKSLSEIYFNTIELLLKKQYSHECEEVVANVFCSKTETTLPAWFNENKLCCKYFEDLEAFGKLSFNKLFDEDNKPSFDFAKEAAEVHLQENQLAFGLQVGLLSMDKSFGRHSSRAHTVSFIHKSYQELFASMFIACYFSKDTRDRIYQYCSTVDNILELANVFKFIGALSQSVFTAITKHFKDILSKYNLTADLTSQFAPLSSYQKMMMQCISEMQEYDRNECKIVLMNIFLYESMGDDDLRYLKNADKTDIVSLHLTSGYECPLQIEIANDILQNSRGLQHLVLQGLSSLPHLSTKDMLEVSSKSIQNCKHIHIQTISLSALDVSKCAALQHLHVEGVKITNIDVSPCGNLKYLFTRDIETLSCIRLSSSLQNISLISLKTLATIDLSPCTNLSYLHLEALHKIEDIDICDCAGLQQLHLQTLPSLKRLSKSAFKPLQHLSLESLEGITEVDFSCCFNLRQLHLRCVENVKNIDLSKCIKLQKLHIGSVWNVNKIDLCACEELKVLHLSSLKNVQFLDLRNCSKLQELTISNLFSLKQLYISECELLRKIQVVTLSKLKALDLSRCVHLEDLHLNALHNIQDLDMSVCIRLRQLHLERLNKLKQIKLSSETKLLQLTLVDIKNIKIPENIRVEELRIQSGWNLQLIDLSKYTDLTKIHIIDFDHVYKISKKGNKSLQELNLQSMSNLYQIDMSGCEQLHGVYMNSLGNISQLDLRSCMSLLNLHLKSLKSMNTLHLPQYTQLTNLNLCNIPSLSHIELNQCSQLQILQIRYLTDVKIINLLSCYSLQHLEISYMRKIRHLDMSACTQLQHIKLKSLHNLQKLDFSGCVNLVTLYVQGCNITIGIELISCVQLHEIYIEDIKAVTKLDLPAFSQVQKIRCVNIRNLHELDLCSCTILDSLDLRSLNISKKLDIVSCQKLQYLYLDGIEGLANLELAKCTRLRNLHLENIRNLTNVDTSHCINLRQLHVKNMRGLKKLDLRTCPMLHDLNIEPPAETTTEYIL